MFNLVKYFASFLIFPLSLTAQISPEEQCQLNYRIIGFSFPQVKKTTIYELQIAPGNINTESLFNEKVSITFQIDTNRIIAEVPEFGKQYTWRVLYQNKRHKQTQSELHHFSIGTSPEIDPDSVRVRITLTNEKYKDGYFFVDGHKVLYDMGGKPVWFLPKFENRNQSSLILRDLNATPFGTITAIVNGRLYEIDYNGHILWRGPENSSVSLDTLVQNSGYHHEFTRLANGHYMAMGFQEPWWVLPGPPDSSVYKLWASKIKLEQGVYYQKMFFSTISEYDEHGNTVWKWNDADYFKNSDLSTRMLPCRLFNLNDTHANAFYFDEQNNNLFISYREISRVLQVSYPDRSVLHTYGKFYVPGTFNDNHLSNNVFFGQHGCRRTSNGDLYLFNNNSYQRPKLPTIMILRNPPPGKDTIEKVWEFECPMENFDEHLKPNEFLFGGNVSELPDSSFFVCMGGTYGRTFIVNRNKQILWSACPEKWDSANKEWNGEGVAIGIHAKEGTYRSRPIDRKQLEQLIWHKTMRQ